MRAPPLPPEVSVHDTVHTMSRFKRLKPKYCAWRTTTTHCKRRRAAANSCPTSRKRLRQWRKVRDRPPPRLTLRRVRLQNVRKTHFHPSQKVTRTAVGPASPAMR